MIKKTFKILAFIALLAGFQNVALADEITAVDFNGNLLGKVIPDGTVISFDNEIIGTITADSLIINAQGDLIGGVIPQGVAIGNDNKLLGKVNNDGTVRLPSGAVIGKVLPNALVINDNFDILGAVLYPGLIYNDSGASVGRLAGDGTYVNFEGQNIGFVSAQGYAYRKSGENYILDGRLIPSKMVTALDGTFLGSVSPGGQVADFEGVVIGKIHANGYVYDADSKIIGTVVSGGYAFDNAGNYLGLVTYNGEVVQKAQTIGRLRGDDVVIDLKGEPIGFRVDVSATATDLDGRYLGRVLPNGIVAKAQAAVGKIGPRQTVLNDSGAVIGELIKAGPMFDDLGDLKGQILRNGRVISPQGTPLGYAQNRLAYNNIHQLMGASLEKAIVLDNNNKILGLTGVSSTFDDNGVMRKISPLGFVFAEDGTLVGQTVSLQPFYTEQGTVQGFLGADGTLQGIPSESGIRLTGYAQTINAQNEITGFGINASFAVSNTAELMGVLMQNNQIMNAEKEPIAKVLPQGNVVGFNLTTPDSLMPVLGQAETGGAVLGFNGINLGYADVNGNVRDASNNLIGRVVPQNWVVGTQKALIGYVAKPQSVVSETCSYMGTVGYKGDVRNARNVVLGRYLSNGQIVSETGGRIGHAVKPGAVYDVNGKPLGTVNVLGYLTDYNAQTLGCLTWDGRFYNNEKVFSGKVVSGAPVMSFDNQILGRALNNAQVVDFESAEIGFVQPDGTFISEDGVEGLLFEYAFAFDNQNKFLGRVSAEGKVLSDDYEELGTVKYDGEVVSADGNSIGYALYDMYAYDSQNNVIGYIGTNGKVYNFLGNSLGNINKGFLVSPDKKLIARGRRDYFVRGAENRVIGEIMLNGEVQNTKGEVIGTVTGSGEVRSEEGDVLGNARPLQFYIVSAEKEPRPADWSGTPKVGSMEGQVLDENEYGSKVVGIALTPDGNYLGDILEDNSVVDKLGNVLGQMSDGLVVDSDGNLIGMEEKDKEEKEQQMFVPAGTFGDGGAYGLGNTPTNLGPGGGFGPGERYDPIRSAALAAAQAQRRSEITVGQLTSNVDRNSFDGMQDNWDGVAQQLSSWRVDMSEMILADKPIPAVLARTIMSSDGADDVPVTAIVERNVYAETGRNIVIPAGSRVMGTSSGGGGSGQSGGAVRTNITWTRLIRPDGSAFEFSAAKTGDAQGRGGALAYLDEQLLKKYTLPVVTSLLTNALAYVTATNETGSTSGESTLESSRQQAANDARQQFLQNMDQIFNQILEDKTNIQAVTYVPAGTRLIIFPKEDLWIRTIDRKESNDKNLEKGPLIDGNEMEDVNKNASTGGGSSSANSDSPSSRGVVYLDEGVDAKPSSGGLIDDKSLQDAKKKKQQTQNIPNVTVSGATPPPPSSSATGMPPSTNANRNDNSGQLF